MTVTFMVALCRAHDAAVLVVLIGAGIVGSQAQIHPRASALEGGEQLGADALSLAGGIDMFLRTDDACTYQFYEHRGFMRAVRSIVRIAPRRGRRKPFQ